MLKRELEDQLIDVLLSESLGEDPAPDFTDILLKRAYPRSRWVRRIAIGSSVAAAAAVILFFVFSGLSGAAYPSPQLSGSYWVTSGSPGQRGMEVSTAESSARLNMGGYVRVDMAPNSRLRVQGEAHRESVRLIKGQVVCSVSTGSGRFGVASDAVALDSSGAKFSAGMVGASDTAELLLSVHSGVVTVDVPGGAVQVSEGDPPMLSSAPITISQRPSVKLHAGMSQEDASISWEKLLIRYPDMLRPIQRSDIVQEGIYVAKVISMPSNPSAGSVSIRVRTARAIVPLDGIVPDEFDLRVRVSSSGLQVPAISDDLYLVRVVRTSSSSDGKQCYYMRPACGYASLREGIGWVVPFPWTNGSFVEEMSGLLANDGTRGEASETLARVLRDLKSKKRILRVLSAQFASVQGWRFIPFVPDGADRFAKTVTRTHVQSIRRMLAGAYTNACLHRRDILPRSARLLRELAYHTDFRTAEPVLRGVGALESNEKRQKMAAVVLAAILEGGKNLDMRRDALLDGISQWSGGLAILEEELRTMTLSLPPHPWPNSQRARAFELLKRSGAWTGDICMNEN